ncbi:MAG: DUF1800 family protein [Candidatus Gracilibacteria bacterium]|nr:DUF1800 family protein [Candidatus Gracilibacteria bacterium]
MLRKIISFFVLISLIGNNFFFFKSYAYETNGANNPWTYEKANHLARKAVFGIDGDNVKQLYQAGSAENAVNLLFPSIIGPDRTDFENKLNNIISGTGFSITNADNMRSYYIVKKGYDPYPAKAKLFTLFEDIFSVFVNTSSDINYIDVENTHDMLYSHTLGNYKEMIKRNLYNNGNPGDYSLGKFLDLFNQTNPKYPNENYAREILQLFLMLEYIPSESEKNGNTKNYNDADVAALSKIIMGFESDENTHMVTYNNAINTNTKINFLDGNLKSGDSFPFYNETTGEIDVQLLKTPIAGNNGLADNIIDYIFSKREYAISMFLADKLYRFYVAENPTRQELDTISSKIISNNFDIYNTVKWLLASDMMYSDKSMNTIIYKNPLELSIGTANIFGLNPENIRIWSLINLGWNPYYPPNIFGRDGFDNNGAFFTAYTETQWVNESSYFVNSLDLSKIISDKIYLTPYAGNDDDFKNILYSNKSELLNLKSGTGSGLSGVVNLKNFQIKDSNNNDIVVNTGSIDFNDFSISINANEKIIINEGRLDYKNSIINITSGIYINNGINKNISGSTEIDGFYLIQKDFTKESLITYLEDKLYLDRKLPIDIRNKLINFLTTDNNGNPVNFDLTNNTFKNYYLKSLIHFMIIQPEYVMQSGYDLSEDIVNGINNLLVNNNSKLIIVKAGGGMDYLHGVIPKNEYDKYLEYRGTGALTGTGIMSLDNDYYINSSLAPFKQLYDSGNLRLINRVGTPDNSRAHDLASQKITSLDNVINIEDDGIIGGFLKNEDYTKTIVMGGYAPLIFRGGNYLNIGSNAYFNIADATSTTFKNYKRNVIKDILGNRNYPGNSKNVFKNSVTINNVALDSYNAGGRPGSGYDMEDNFIFLETIFDSNISSIARMSADGGYDTHGNQKDTLNNNFDKVADRTVEYFNRVKNKEDVTILLFSEFGRTNKMTASMGTDHGKAGGMFIISNNTKLLSSLDKKVYGNMSFKDSKENWLGVGVDYRAVYSSVLESLYGKDISPQLGGTFDIDDYVDTNPPKIELFRKEYEYYNTSRTKIKLKFNVDDINFKPSEASYVKIQYGKDQNNLFEESQYNISRYMTVNEDNLDIYLNNIESKATYFYKITIYDNQYSPTILEGSFVSPEVKNNTDNISLDSDSRLGKYNNLKIGLNYDLDTNTSSGILVGDKVIDKDIIGENSITIKTSSGTYVNNLFSSSTGTIWNGGFVVPQEINKEYFLAKNSNYNGELLSKYTIDKIIKVGADQLGVGMKLNKNVTIKIPNLDVSKNYTVLSSEDGINWIRENNSRISKNGGNLDLIVNHFTYFALVETDSSGNIIVPKIIEPGNTNPGDNNSGNNNSGTGNQVEDTTKTYSSGGGGSTLRRDVCKYGDFSPSYYDNSCGVDPDQKVATMGVEQSETYRLEQAVEQMREKEEYKAQIYDTTFKNSENLSDKKSVLNLLLEKISYVEIGNYKLANIEGSPINTKLSKIGQFIIDQNFSKEYTQKLINNLNDLLVYISISKMGNIDSDTKANALKKLNEVIRDFSINFKNARKKIKIKKVVNNDIEPTGKNIIQIKNTQTKVNEQKEIIKTNNTIQKQTTTNEFKLKTLQFKVNVDNLYLKADPYWKENVGILEKGDIVEQITQLHEKGFFMIKVIKSKNLKEGTTGYIFSKYLSK